MDSDARVAPLGWVGVMPIDDAADAIGGRPRYGHGEHDRTATGMRRAGGPLAPSSRTAPSACSSSGACPDRGVRSTGSMSGRFLLAETAP